MKFWKKIFTITSMDFSKISFGNFVGNGLSALFWIILAMFVSSSEYGELVFYIAVGTIVGTLSFLGSGPPLIVLTAKNVKIQSTIYILTITCAVISSIILQLIFSNIGLSLYVVGYVIFNLILNETLGKKNYGKYAKYYLFQRSLSFILPMTFYHFLGSSWILLGLSFAFLPFIVKIVPVLRERKIDLKLLRSNSKFIVNSFGVDTTKIMTFHLDKIFIFPIFGPSILGSYQLGLQVLYAASILPHTIFSYILPKESSGTNESKLKIFTIISSVFIAILGLILIPFLTPIVFPKFSNLQPVLEILIIGLIPITITYMYMAKFLSNNNSKAVFIGSSIFLVSQITLIFTLGKTFSTEGLAMATVIAATIESIYLFFYNYKIYHSYI